MKVFSRLLLAASIALPLSACGGGGLIDDFVALDTAKAAAFEVGGDDCDAKAPSVAKWRAENNARYKELQEALNKEYPEGPPDDAKAKHGEQLQKNKKAVMGAVIKCADNEAFGKAIDENG